MKSSAESSANKPTSVTNLEQIFGGPSQNAFGSAVFYDPDGGPPENLESLALAWYQHFAGKTWEQFGKDNWLANWRLVHARDTGQSKNIVAELQAIADSEAMLSASMLMENHEDSKLAQLALAQCFDNSAVQDLRVYRIGDGQAMSGLLIAARREPVGSVYLVFLMD